MNRNWHGGDRLTTGNLNEQAANGRIFPDIQIFIKMIIV